MFPGPPVISPGQSVTTRVPPNVNRPRHAPTRPTPPGQLWPVYSETLPTGQIERLGSPQSADGASCGATLRGGRPVDSVDLPRERHATCCAVHVAVPSWGLGMFASFPPHQPDTHLLMCPNPRCFSTNVRGEPVFCVMAAGWFCEKSG